jgi:para-nitrobenzyl esterase
MQRSTRALLAVTLLLSVLPGAAFAADRVRTANGVVEGVTAPSGIQIFRGIPFAAPPMRELRWRAPQPAANWEGVRRADRFAPQCMQARIYSDMVFRNDGTSEDCLYLNVWTPSPSASARLPVLVYFYGGGFMAGDGSEPRYDGESMARKGMVVVTMSYRLGIFGFFSHPELSAENAQHASGNYGLMDQTAALRWVQQNIAAFGGDPRRVTIAGESAGSFSVSAQMASPLAKDLIAGAIGESGSLLAANIAPRETSEQSGVRFAEAVGARSLADLRAMSSFEILDAASRQGMPRFSTNVDGLFFTEPPAATFAAGRQARVPLLAGWNSAESSGRSIVPDPTPEAFTAALNRIFGESGAEAARVYAASTPEEVAQVATDLAGDQFIAFGTWKWLDEHARSGQPVYRYYYSRPRPGLRNPPPPPANANPNAAAAAAARWPAGAAHSAEIEYAMGNLALNPVYAWTPEDQRLSSVMQEYFANFVKTGNPNGTGLPNWPAGRVAANGEVMRMRLDVETRAEPEAHRDRYLFLQRYNAARQ